MAVDTQEIFANLAEKEKLRGHHSHEGRAMRTLCRALSGWSAQLLDVQDVLTLCDQAVTDWLRTRCQISLWSNMGVDRVLSCAAESKLITLSEAVRLQTIHHARNELRSGLSEITDVGVEAELMFCIELVNQHW